MPHMNLDRESFQELVFSASEGIPDVSSSKILLHVMPVFNGQAERESCLLLRGVCEQLSQSNDDGYASLAGSFLCRENRYDAGIKTSDFHLADYVERMVAEGYYTSQLVSSFRASDWEVLSKLINFRREELVPIEKQEREFDAYCIKSSAGTYVETPVLAQLVLCASTFQFDKKRRLANIESLFKLIRKEHVFLPREITKSLRTPAAALTIGSHLGVEDSLDGIANASGEILKLGAAKSPISISLGAVRGKGAGIGLGKVHGGIMPIAKHFVTATTVCRCESSLDKVSFSLPFWHSEVIEILSLLDEPSIRDCSLIIQVSKMFYERVTRDEEITLMSPDKSGELYKCFLDNPAEFDRLYQELESTGEGLLKIKASSLIGRIAYEASQGANVGIQHVDLSSEFSQFKVGSEVCIGDSWIPVKKTLGGRETALSTTISHKMLVDDALVTSLGVLMRAMDNMLELNLVRLSSEVNYLSDFRPLTINVDLSGLPKDSWREEGFSQRLESLYFAGLRTSIRLASERGACSRSADLRLAEGTLPMSHYKSNSLDKLAPSKLRIDGTEVLIQFEKFGLRNAVIFGQVTSGYEGQEDDAIIKAVCQRYLGSPQEVVLAQGTHGLRYQIANLLRCYQLGVRVVRLTL